MSRLLLAVALALPWVGRAQEMTIQVPSVEMRGGGFFLKEETLMELKDRFFLSVTNKANLFNGKTPMVLDKNDRRGVFVIARQMNVHVPKSWSEIVFIYSTDQGNRFKLFMPEPGKPLRLSAANDGRVGIVNDNTVVVNGGLVIADPVELGVGACEKELEVAQKRWKADKLKISQDQVSYLGFKSWLMGMDAALEFEVREAGGELEVLGQSLHAANSKLAMLNDLMSKITLDQAEKTKFDSLKVGAVAEVDYATTRAKELERIKKTAEAKRGEIAKLLEDIVRERKAVEDGVREKLEKEVGVKLQESSAGG